LTIQVFDIRIKWSVIIIIALTEFSEIFKKEVKRYLEN